MTATIIAGVITLLGTLAAWYFRPGKQREEISNEIIKLEKKRDEVRREMDLAFTNHRGDDWNRLNAERMQINASINRLRERLG